jgi:hypothetical protein
VIDVMPFDHDVHDRGFWPMPLDFDEVSVVRRWSGPDRLPEESGRFCAGDRLGECSELRLREMGTSSFAGGCGVAA